MEPTGKINVYVNGGSSGNSIETTVVQLTADALGADIDDVATIQGDTAVTPVRRGHPGQPERADDRRRGRRGGDHPARPVARDGGPHPRSAARSDRTGLLRATAVDDPTKSVGFADLAYRAHYEPQQLPAGMSATLEATARFTSQTPIHWANATHACTCEVDVTTGRVTLTRYIVSGTSAR